MSDLDDSEFEQLVLDGLDADDVEQLAELSDEDLAHALAELLYVKDPLAGYCTPVTRLRKPPSIGRRVVDLPPL